MKICYDCGRLLPEDIDHFPQIKGKISGQCLDCRKKYMKDYYEKNKTKWQGYAAKRSPEENRKRARDWQRNNPEKARRRQSNWRRAHPEVGTKRGRRLRAENPEVYRCYVRNRRALLKNAPGTHTAKDIVDQLDSQAGLCFYCGKELDTCRHVDHFIPLSKGGSNGPENIVIACRSCNLRKNAKMPEVFIAELRESCSA